MCALKKLPVILIRQNLKRLVELRYTGVKRRLGMALITWLEWRLRSLPIQPVVLAVGDEMYREYSGRYEHVHRVALPIVSTRDIIGPEEKAFPVVGDENPLRLLFVGRLDPEKGLSNFLKAVEILINSGMPVRATLVGDGPVRAELEQQSRNLGISSVVDFPGYVTHGLPLFDYYRQSDLLVMPSLSEGFPKVIPEAMAFRLPVVATTVGGIPEIIHHDENGILIPPGDPVAIADAVKRLVREPAFTGKLLDNSTELASRYTIEHWLETIVSILAPRLSSGSGKKDLP